VAEYCQYLSQALAAQGISLELKRIGWAELGWRRALGEFRKSTLEARSTDWFLLQYTALGWSRRGFSIRALRVIRLLKSRGARCAVVLHDIEAYYGSRPLDRIRRAVQNWTMRQGVRLADLAIFTIPPEIIRWLPPNTRHAVFIPVGANLPGPEAAWRQTKVCAKEVPTVAVFSLSDGSVRAEEVRDIAQAARHAAERMGKLRVVLLGRNSEVGAEELKERLTGTPVEVAAHGLVAAEQVVQILGSCDVMLFARGFLSTRRGSAIAGMACGLPVVGREGWEMAAPITEAGVVLVSGGEREGFGPALLRVLSDESYRSSLAERSKNAHKQYFSWDVIAAQYARALTGK
jgi:glycosyltransferase involved in cell wall biosynthesis